MSYKHDQQTRDNWARQKRNQRNNPNTNSRQGQRPQQQNGDWQDQLLSQI
jgi:hypothetical protein